MSIKDRFIKSVQTSPTLWIGLWALLLLNMLMVLVLTRGVSWAAGVVFAVLILAGGLAILKIARYSPVDTEMDDDLKERLDKLMEEIRPYCQDVFDNQVNSFLEPIEQEFQQKFSRGLAWLWEKVDDFYAQL